MDAQFTNSISPSVVDLIEEIGTSVPISYLGSYKLSASGTSSTNFIDVPNHHFGIFKYVRGSYNILGIVIPEYGAITQILSIDNAYWAAVRDDGTRAAIVSPSKITNGTIYLFG